MDKDRQIEVLMRALDDAQRRAQQAEASLAYWMGKAKEREAGDE